MTKQSPKRKETMTDISTPKTHQIVTMADIRARRGLTEEDLAPHIRETRLYMDGYALGEVRRAQKVTQRELAQRIGVSQNRISKIEKGQFDKTQIGTIQKYIEALGGQITLDATFGDTVVPLHLG